jgi:hypothetical protein
MSMPTPAVGSPITRFVSVPVFCGVHGWEPEILVALMKRISAADAVRSSVMRTS